VNLATFLHTDLLKGPRVQYTTFNHQHPYTITYLSEICNYCQFVTGLNYIIDQILRGLTSIYTRMGGVLWLIRK